MLNSIALVGRLTREPEEFKGATRFSLAFNQGKNSDGSDNTGFIDVVTFDKLATSCGEWLSKGDKVAISGRINHKKFARKDGTTGSTIEILASSVEFIDVLKTAEENVEEPNEEELPFEPDPEVKVAPKQESKPVAKPTRTRR